MSSIYKNKVPLTIISNLLKKLLDSKLSALEKKNEDEMNKIKSISQNSEIIINQIKGINRNLKHKEKSRKSIVSHCPLNITKKYNLKIPSKLNTSSIISNYNVHTPNRKNYSKKKLLKNNNNIKKIKRNKSIIISNDLLSNKSHNTSKILNDTKNNNKIAQKSRSKKKIMNLTPRSNTSRIILKKKRKEKQKLKKFINNQNLIKHNNTNIISNKKRNKSCKNLARIKKDRLNLSGLLKKNDELDLICTSNNLDDKRIYDLSPNISSINILKKRKIKKIKSLFLNESFHKNENKEILAFEDSMMNDVNNDELLISYSNNKKPIRFIDDINMGKSFLFEISARESDLENNLKNNITFSEKLENSLEYFAKFLTKEELLKIGLLNKECFKMIMHYFISKIEDTLDDIKESLSQLKKNNEDVFDNNDENNNFSIKPFEFNINSNRAISLLNSLSIESIFLIDKSGDINNKYIILIFDLFFIALGYKKQILNFKNDNKSKWNFYRNYFEKNCSKLLGNSIENKIKGKIFSNEIINSLYEYSFNYINIITPNYYQKLNNNIAIFVFIVKNILEHVGITRDADNKKNVVKLYLLYNARISINNIILQKLNEINSIIINKK